MKRLVAVLLAALALIPAATASRPGFYSQATVSPETQPTEGDVLTAGDGGLSCDPGCVPNPSGSRPAPDPSRVGVFYQWIRCPVPHGGGRQSPPGGLPDEGGPCPEPRLVVSTGRDRTFRIPAGWAQWHVQANVIAVNHDCGEVNHETGEQECAYSRGESWSRTVGPVKPPNQPPPPPATSPTEAELLARARDGARPLLHMLRARGLSWNSVKSHPYGVAYYDVYGGR